MKIAVSWRCGHLNVADGSAVGGAPELLIYRDCVSTLLTVCDVVSVPSGACACACVSVTLALWLWRAEWVRPSSTLLLPGQRGRQPRAPGVFWTLCLA